MGAVLLWRQAHILSVKQCLSFPLMKASTFLQECRPVASAQSGPGPEGSMPKHKAFLGSLNVLQLLVYAQPDVSDLSCRCTNPVSGELTSLP